MPTAEENSPPYTEQDYYAFFFNGLAGLIDDAELNGYSREGVELLRQAQSVFKEEFQRRHPEWWRPTD